MQSKKDRREYVERSSLKRQRIITQASAKLNQIKVTELYAQNH